MPSIGHIILNRMSKPDHSVRVHHTGPQQQSLHICEIFKNATVASTLWICGICKLCGANWPGQGLLLGLGLGSGVCRECANCICAISKYAQHNLQIVQLYKLHATRWRPQLHRPGFVQTFICVFPGLSGLEFWTIKFQDFPGSVRTLTD